MPKQFRGSVAIDLYRSKLMAVAQSLLLSKHWGVGVLQPRMFSLVLRSLLSGSLLYGSCLCPFRIFVVDR